MGHSYLQWGAFLELEQKWGKQTDHKHAVIVFTIWGTGWFAPPPPSITMEHCSTYIPGIRCGKYKLQLACGVTVTAFLS